MIESGWEVFNEDTHPEIQRIDETDQCLPPEQCRTFATDEDAILHVLRHAATNEKCREAIRLCYKI